jgi:hypothetical protein
MCAIWVDLIITEVWLAGNCNRLETNRLASFVLARMVDTAIENAMGTSMNSEHIRNTTLELNLNVHLVSTYWL